jgi:hypothetical protein
VGISFGDTRGDGHALAVVEAVVVVIAVIGIMRRHRAGRANDGVGDW